MDLISRKAVLDFMKGWKGKGCKGETIEYVRNLPSVPAVPMDKLCEWLAERYEPPYSLVDIDKLKMPIDFRQQKEIWMNVLTMWMEGLDAAD